MRPGKRFPRWASVVLCLALLAGGSVRPVAATPAPDFLVAWYDTVTNPQNLAAIAGDGMTTVIAYHSPGASVRGYLDAASSAGVKVMVEIPRALVKKVDVKNVKAFVALFETHPALRAWYLADEPSLTKELGPLSASNATKLYNAIKQEDPTHQVAIVFSTREDPKPYLSALDILLHDHYPFSAPSSEFYGLGTWLYQTNRMAVIAKSEQGFFPVLQAMGGTNEEPELGLRAPTAREERYMAYAAVWCGADGLFFWTYYRADPQWVDSALAPLVAEMAPLRPALAAGNVSGLVTTSRTDVTANVFRDPVSGSHYVVAIHHGDGTVDAPLTFEGSLSTATSATLLADPPATVTISDGRLAQSLDSWDVKVYRID
jgi:hypothetical protein